MWYDYSFRPDSRADSASIKALGCQTPVVAAPSSFLGRTFRSRVEGWPSVRTGIYRTTACDSVPGLRSWDKAVFAQGPQL